MKRKNIRSDLEKKLSGRIKGYAHLFLSLAIVIIFVLFLAPEIDNVPRVKPLINFIDEHEINATALYYTDIEEFSVAEFNMKNTLDYSPCFISDKKNRTITDSSKKK